ncbi:MAG TPA: hypothetical protein VGL19_09135 [Polyangiaceae bacterium]|jgi:hypothetical protein
MFRRLLPGLSPAARSLLDAERVQREDDELKARALERARATLQGERWSGVRISSSEQLAPAARTRFSRLVLPIAAVLAVAGLASAGMHLAASRAPASGATTVVEPGAPQTPAAPAAVAPSSVSLAAATEAEEAVAPVVGSPRVEAHVRPTPAQQYALEVAELEPARLGIGRRDYDSALRAIARHRRDYPAGLLAEEREALHVRALWGMGNQSAAKAAAETFRKRYPRSALLSWMQGQ